MEFDHLDLDRGARAVQEVRKFVEDLKKYPDTDLFKEYA
jgi:hypothetical protein